MTYIKKFKIFITADDQTVIKKIVRNSMQVSINVCLLNTIKGQLSLGHKFHYNTIYYLIMSFLQEKVEGEKIVFFHRKRRSIKI